MNSLLHCAGICSGSWPTRTCSGSRRRHLSGFRFATVPRIGMVMGKTVAGIVRKRCRLGIGIARIRPVPPLSKTVGLSGATGFGTTRPCLDHALGGRGDQPVAVGRALDLSHSVVPCAHPVPCIRAVTDWRAGTTRSSSRPDNGRGSRFVRPAHRIRRARPGQRRRGPCGSLPCAEPRARGPDGRSARQENAICATRPVCTDGRCRCLG